MADFSTAIADLAQVAGTLAEVDFAAEPELADDLVEMRRQLERLESSWLRP